MTRTIGLFGVCLVAAISGASRADAQGLLHFLVGDSPYDRFGNSSGSGDVDGDGCADLVVGARYDDATGHSSGSAFVFSGKSGALLHTFSGTSSYQLFGLAVGHAGDVDQDGYDDVLVGAYADNTQGYFKGGATKVFSGATGALIHAFFGESLQTELGWSVAGAADVDGDGHPDILAGAPDEVGASGSGSARLYSGATGQLRYKIWGAAPATVFGHSVTMLQDADGDGFADFAVSALAADSAAGVDSGSVTIYSGRDATVLHVITGESAQDNFGVWAQHAGDVDGDGRSDIIVGAYHDDDGGVDAGSALVFSTANGKLLRRHDGVLPGEHFGHSVSGAGDVDGDGHADYLVGAPHASINGTESGRAVLFSGRDGTPLREFAGDSANDRLGGSVSGSFDANGDGSPDFAMGAMGDDQGGAESGSLWIYSGCDDCTIHSYGLGCAGSLPGAPRLYVTGSTAAGGQVDVAITDGPPAGAAWLMVGTPGSGTSIGGGCTLLLAAVAAVIGPLPLDGNGDSHASAIVPGGLPPLTIAVQAALPDAGTPLGLVLSNAVALAIGP